MELPTLFYVLFYGFQVCFLAYKVIHEIHQRRQEKKLAECFDKLDKFLQTKSLR